MIGNTTPPRTENVMRVLYETRDILSMLKDDMRQRENISIDDVINLYDYKGNILGDNNPTFCITAIACEPAEPSDDNI